MQQAERKLLADNQTGWCTQRHKLTSACAVEGAVCCCPYTSLAPASFADTFSEARFENLIPSNQAAVNSDCPHNQQPDSY